ncbi:MAG TPA: hypothetical protein VIK62_04715 [Verrucomicrobiae bacterium]
MAQADQTIKESIGKYLSHCPGLEKDARYWFFRTDGGSLFEPFVTAQSIAIGYPYVGLKTLLGLNWNRENKKALTKQIKIHDPDEKRPGLAAGQLLTFAHLMKAGDYVIIPSHGSHDLAIGRITSKPPFEKKLVHDGVVIEGFAKQRGVRWIKRVKRTAVNPNLFQILYAHQTVTDITDCAQWIDSLLFDFFKKGDEYHYILEVNQVDGINARELFQAVVDIFKLADDFSSEIGIAGADAPIDTRINLNSPGEIELITKAAEFIFVAAAIIIGLNGGGLKFKVNKLGIDLNMSTDGLIKKVNTFLNDRKNRQLSDSVRNKLDTLKIDSAADVLDLIERINKK